MNLGRLAVVNLPFVLCCAWSPALSAADAPTKISADLVVYAATPGGIVTAVAAARQKLKVVIAEPTRHVGGMSASGVGTTEFKHMLYWTSGGISMEFYNRVGDVYGTGQAELYFEAWAAEKAFLKMLEEQKIKVLFGQRVAKVEKSGTKIDRITLTDGTVLEGRAFVDASYEGDLMARAGVSYTWGREPRSQYGESLAGIHFEKTSLPGQTVDEQGKLLPGISAWKKDLREGDGDRKAQVYNFRFTFTQRPENRAPVPKPAHYDRARYKLLENWLHAQGDRRDSVRLFEIMDLTPRQHWRVEVNDKQKNAISTGFRGGQFEWPDADYAKRDQLYQDHKDYTLGLVHFLATDPSVPEPLRKETQSWGLPKDEYPDNEHFPYHVYVREARRMLGEYVMTQRDVTEDRHKPDSIGMSSHFIDSHDVQCVAVSPTEFMIEGRLWEPGLPYQIPYRALVPKAAECTNLLVPCAASFSHVAFCTYRLETVWMIAGQACGLAMEQVVRDGKTVQQVDVPKLQAQLREQKQVVDFMPAKPQIFLDQ